MKAKKQQKKQKTADLDDNWSDLSTSDIELYDVGDVTTIRKGHLDQDLWDDWQKTIAIDHQQVSSPAFRPKEKKKIPALGKPILISVPPGQLPIIPLPNILRVNFKKIDKSRKNDYIIPAGNKIAKTKQNKKSIITICKSIIADEIIKEQCNTIKKKPKNNDEDGNKVTENSINDEEINLDQVENVEQGQLPHFYTLGNKVICIVEPKTKFSFHGKLKIKVLCGAVKIYGAIFNELNTESPIKVYSPRGTSLVSIEAADYKIDQKSVSQVWKVLSKNNVDHTIENELHSQVNNLKQGSAVLTFQNFENSLTNFLGEYFTHRLFPKIEDSTNYTWSDPRRATVLLQANFYSEISEKQTSSFDKTYQVIDQIIERSDHGKSSKTIITGGKNVGKSTTARKLINKMLEVTNSVILLDFDPGQAEFTPSGCISLNIVQSPLLGPNFTHLKTPYHQIYIGSVDVTKCITNYIEGVQKLIQILNETPDLKEMPVVINTMGFCRGIGWDIICFIIKSINPTDIFQIISKKAKNNFDQLLTHDIINQQSLVWNVEIKTDEFSKYELHVLETMAENRKRLGEGWNIEPHQQREITMLAYLSGIINQPNEMLIDGEKNKKNINAIVPYEVPFSSVKVSLDKPVVHQVLSVINGNIVALCGSDFKDGIEESTGNLSYPKVLIRAPLSTCYGFGLVRGVDMESKKLYLNTPLPMSGLNHVNCLIGCMPVPSGLLQLRRPGLPYAGGECDLPTSRDPRRGYFRMRQRNDA